MYHGRRDHMVKVHGFRVELGEVESRSRMTPACAKRSFFPTIKSLSQSSFRRIPLFQFLD